MIGPMDSESVTNVVMALRELESDKKCLLKASKVLAKHSSPMKEMDQACAYLWEKKEKVREQFCNFSGISIELGWQIHEILSI